MDDNVQGGTVSQEGIVSTVGEAEAAPPQEQPLTKEAVQQMIAEAAALAREQGRREMQGTKDREVAEAQRRVQLAEERLGQVSTRFKEVDPDAANLADQSAELQYYRRQGAEEAQRQQIWATIKTFESNMSQFITDLGIDPNDKRIDWGDPNSQSLNERQSRILKSVGAIQKESVKTGKDSLKRELNEWKLQAEKDLGIHSHDTSISPGISKGIPTDRKKLAEWVSSLSTEEYKKRKTDIDEALEKGLIK